MVPQQTCHVRREQIVHPRTTSHRRQLAIEVLVTLLGILLDFQYIRPSLVG